MTPSERLLDRLRNELGLKIPKTAYIRRTYASAGQRAGGAWSWILDDYDPLSPYALRLGSQWPVTELLRARRLEAYQDSRSPGGIIEIVPTGS